MTASVDELTFLFSDRACRRLDLEEGSRFTIDLSTWKTSPGVLEQDLALLRRARLSGLHVEFLETRLYARDKRCVHVYTVQDGPVVHRPLEETRTPGYQTCTRSGSGEYEWFDRVEINRSRYILRTFRKGTYD